MAFMRFRKRECQFCKKKLIDVDYKDSELLSYYISETGKIRPAKRTGTCAKHQRKLSKAIKQARYLGMIPYSIK